MAQYKVPQNIDLKDRLIGPLTLFQFLYLLGGGMVFYITLKSPGAGDLIIIGIPAAALALAFAFVKINDQPFSRFIYSLILYLINPKTRVWDHSQYSAVHNVVSGTKTEKKQIKKKELEPGKINIVAQKLDEKNILIHR